MKSKEKKHARALRKKGFSIKEISAKLTIAKSSASLWVRDIELTRLQKKRLSAKGHSFEVIEKRRAKRLHNENAKRQIIIDSAKREVRSISNDGLFLIGVSLYWAEGSKTKRGVVEFSNSDPRLVLLMKRFFTEICAVPEEKLRGHVYLHPHLDANKAERYWSRVTGVPRRQFYKTSQQHNRASKGKKDSLPFGTFSINICSTELFLRIVGWTEGICDTLLQGDIDTKAGKTF